MRTYEALYIVQPNATDDEVQTIDAGVQRLITEGGGSVVRSEIWGKRRLAYEVKRFQEGIYILVRFQCPSDAINKLKQYFKLTDDIIRDLVVQYNEQTLKLEQEQAQRDEILAAQRAAAESRGETDSDDDDDDERPARRSRAYAERD